MVFYTAYLQSKGGPHYVSMLELLYDPVIDSEEESQVFRLNSQERVDSSRFPLQLEKALDGTYAIWLE